MSSFKWLFAVAVTATCVAATTHAQDSVTWGGIVVDPQALPLPGATVDLRTTNGNFVATTSTERDGRFVFTVPAGTYRVSASLLGFDQFTEEVSISQAVNDFRVELQIGTFSQEVAVSASMPEFATESVVPAIEAEQRAVRDIAEHLRTEAGLSAVRRGPINLEPTVRGLQETQVAMFVDGTRTFAAGPARMDSDISHVSPHALQAVRVVKGPYALTWGAGALSAVRVDTFRPSFTGGEFVLGGRVGANYGQSGDTADGFAGIWGSNGRARFTVYHNTRTANDYEDGDDNVIPGDYESFDTRWTAGFKPNAVTTLDYLGGHQEQRDVDYAGRILDATFFKTHSHAGELTMRPRSSAVSEVYAQVYANLKDHLMNNDEKPTALASIWDWSTRSSSSPARPRLACRVDGAVVRRVLGQVGWNGNRATPNMSKGPLRLDRERICHFKTWLYSNVATENRRPTRARATAAVVGLLSGDHQLGSHCRKTTYGLFATSTMNMAKRPSVTDRPDDCQTPTSVGS